MCFLRAVISPFGSNIGFGLRVGADSLDWPAYAVSGVRWPQDNVDGRCRLVVATKAQTLLCGYHAPCIA